MRKDRRLADRKSQRATEWALTAGVPAGPAHPAVSPLAAHNRPRRAPTLAAVLATGLLVALLSGCGKSAQLNTSTVEQAIAASILAQRHVHTTVACPSNVPRRAGVVFTCTAKLQVGKYPVTVTQLNNIGYVRYQNPVPLILLDKTRVEQAIAHSILTQRHQHATITCPGEVLQQAGIVFTCTATIKGVHYPFEVTQTDGRGNVRYIGR